MKLGNRAKFKIEYLLGYPLVNLTEKHFTIEQGYSLSVVSYVRPKPNSNFASAKVVLLSPYGDLVEEELELEFDHTEAERIIAALDPSSFSLRENTYIIDNPKKISPIDIVNEYEDVIVLSVTPKSTKKPGVWELQLQVRFATSDTTYEVVLLIDYNTLTSEAQVANSNSLVNQSQVDEAIPNELVEEFVINDEFLKSSPPAQISLDVIIPSEGVDIRRIEYFPPEDIDSRLAAFKVEFTQENSKSFISKLVKFEFAKTIREAADAAMKSTYETDFTYLGEDRISPPVEMGVDDFEYVGKLTNLKIVDVIYNYNAIEEEIRFIQIDLIVEYKSINYKINKTIEFAHSKADYFNGQFRETHQESESITFADKNLEPLFLMKVANKNGSAIKELIAGAKISKNFPYSRIVDVKLSRFIPNSRVAIFAIKAEEIKGKAKVIHSFEKIQQLKLTYNEALLEKMTPEDILIKQDALPLSPEVDFDETVFIVPSFTTIDSIQYSKPALDSREVKVQLKFRLDNRFVFLEKVVQFKMSISEFKRYQIDLFEQDYLMNISPKDISIKVDLDGRPVNSISNNDIMGIPDGVHINVEYKKPKSGVRVARVILHLSKGNSKVAFEQTLTFAKPAE